MHNRVCLLLAFCILNALPAWSVDSESLILGCGLGEGGGKDADGRQWSPDNKYLSGGNSITSKASFQDPSLLSEIPYMTARVFTSEATYKFPVQSDKRYWLRLHFYPSVYGSFNPSDSYFSVKANGVTLLANFSASITCQALSQAYLDREYSLAPLNSDTLTVTFKPSDKHNGAFAFVNGIQLIQMPELFDSASMVGYADQTVDAKSLHLQTMFRLNVGGQYISPVHDSGLNRMWYDDTPYLFGAATGVTTQADKKVKINYESMPQYIAPPDVYSTSRSMGTNKDVNMGYNLTWIFQVDPNSMYLTRLHFCDFYFSKVNEIVFNIYVNNQTAEAQADVIGWTGGKAVPTYKDYVVYVQDGPGDEQLWLALHPAPDTKPEYYDAILNGVEIFKLNDTDLSGPNPQPSDMLVEHEEKERTFQDNKHQKRTFVIGGAAGGAAGFALVAAICVVVHQKKRRSPGSYSNTSSWLPLYGNSNTTGTKSTGSGKSVGSANLAMAQGLCRYFSLQEMKQATKNFDEANVIGVGGFGKVYKGVVDNGFKVAIKRSNPQSEQGVNEFQTEIEMLSKLRHKHLVSLIGFCEEDDEMCLVYDYMALGTLREHLYKGNKPLDTLSWKQRPALNPNLPKEQVSLADWALLCKRKGTLEDIIDPNLKGKINPESLKKFADAAEKCLSDHGLDRPSMNDLLWNLEFALNLQENPDGSSHAPRVEESEFEEVSLQDNDMAAHYRNLKIGSENEISQDSSENSAPIFSQMVNPKGR
ncbi:Serine-threonine/tyrosine-protein kinase, catalytic domain [Sesbania bispinosa]|nr:Serine-threonine/tyrosine-protein kinase, catalytic domain [Sesbania bispinosa]